MKKMKKIVIAILITLGCMFTTTLVAYAEEEKPFWYWEHSFDGVEYMDPYKNDSEEVSGSLYEDYSRFEAGLDVEPSRKIDVYFVYYASKILSLLFIGAFIYALVRGIKRFIKGETDIHGNYRKQSRSHYDDQLDSFMHEMNRNMDEVNRNMHEEQQRNFQEANQRYQDWATQESLRSVTPFEHGGYDMNQGNSFNQF